MVQPVPTHEQSGAWLHATKQPPAHLVILHVCALWHVSVQLPPVHSIVHVSAVQSSTHAPDGGHVIEHDAEPLHVWWHPPEHDSEHVDADSHVYWQSPPSGQLSVHVVLGGQSHV